MTQQGEDDALDFFLLGPLRVSRQGSPLDVRGDRTRAALALLLVRRNRAVSAAVFAGEVWERDEADVAANLQVLISNLRRTLAAQPPRRSRDTDPQRHIRTSPAGYSLTVGDDHIDVARFRAHAARGDAARGARRPADAAAAFGAALAEWSGDRALQDLAGLGFADAFAAGMSRELLLVRQSHIEAELACGRHREVMGELSVLNEQHPLDEVLCGQLLTTMAVVGRSLEAADVYHRFRERYERELDSPVPDTLRRVWAAVSRHQPVPGHYDAVNVAVGDATVVDEGVSRLDGELVRGDGSRLRLAGRCVLGRTAGDVLLADAKVSKTHAVIVATGEGFVISDLQSTNGTYVNGDVVVAPRVLEHLDRIRLGSTELVFRLNETATG